MVGLYAGTTGALDEIETASVGAYEEQLLRLVEDKYGRAYEILRDEKKMTDECKGLLDQAIAEMKNVFHG